MQKRMMGIGCSAVMSAVVLAAGALRVHSERLISDGGFETPAATFFKDDLPDSERQFYPGMTDTGAEGWAFGGAWDGGRYTVHLSDDAHFGRHAIEIRCEEKGRGGIAAAPFKVSPGTILKVTLWVKAKGGEDGEILLNFEGTPGDGWASERLAGGTFDWKQVTRRCVVPARGNQEDGQAVALFIYSKCAGSVWIDDVAAEVINVNELAESPSAPALEAPRPQAIPEPAGSTGYRVDVATSLDKVRRNTDFAPADELTQSIRFSLARNEYEGAQIIVEAPWRDVEVADVRFSELKNAAGATIPQSAITWWRVGYIETMFEPSYRVPYVGWYPDPLLPAGPFTVEASSRRPVWFSVKTADDTPAGVYHGSVTVSPKGLPPTTLPLTITVWNFAVPEQGHLRTLTWMGMGSVNAFYAFGGATPEARKARAEMHERYVDMVLAHRLGPGGEVVGPLRKRNGVYDFSGIDATLENLIGKGMNAFIMATAPNLHRARKDEYTPEFIARFSETVKALGDHLREKGWIDKAYVYTYDECPRKHWDEVKKIAAAIKAKAPEVRILQCLNQPAGVKELAGHVDVFDVYVAQYHKTGVETMQREKGTEVWLAVCCYPAKHPNLFIEYPLIDARVLAMFCWKYNAAGFEYWSVNAWGSNWRKQGEDVWYRNGKWDPNTFGKYNGDGYLLYPGPDGVPYPSIRLKALRDGFEDYEYLWLLNRLVKRARAAGQAPAEAARAAALVAMNDLITDDGGYRTVNADYFAFRSRVAASIVALEKALGE